ncbi:MAG: DUF4114 domain-containing protein, partial [Myxococcales bacterium]|nr:DUF4114 domain-containing protein [Myxococcales bacterium]
MSPSPSKALVRAALVGTFGLLLFVPTATADVLHQPGGAQIPSQMGCDSGHPTGLAAELACVCDSGGGCNVGDPCPSQGNCTIPQGTCETTLYHEFNDNTCIPSQLEGLDPWTDGSLEPETFMPTCALTFKLLSRGTARFGDIFGWYNVTGSAPAPTELFPMLDCNATRGTEAVLDVRNDPRWTGGEIGFFIATPEQHGNTGQCAGGDCCAKVDRLAGGDGYVFYSQRELNPDSNGPDSLIHLIVYDSVLTERKFFFAWEDIYGGSNNDFTDIVTSVTGVECSGGGESCSTGEPGVCQYGVTTCRGSSIECTQVYDATEEGCDGADNDCDGMIDEGGVCTDDVVGNCTGVTCDAGLVCRQGACVDPCDNVDCPSGQTCLTGVCLPGCTACNGVVCGNGSSCNLDTGDCVGPGDPGGPDAGAGGGGDDDGGGGQP